MEGPIRPVERPDREVLDLAGGRFDPTKLTFTNVVAQIRGQGKELRLDRQPLQPQPRILEPRTHVLRPSSEGCGPLKILLPVFDFEPSLSRHSLEKGRSSTMKPSTSIRGCVTYQMGS